MKRLMVFLGIAILLAVSWLMFAQIPLHVIGQPVNTGLLPHAKEESFFAGLADATGLPYFGLNGYAISLKKWHPFSAREQAILQGAFDADLDDPLAGDWRDPGKASLLRESA